MNRVFTGALRSLALLGALAGASNAAETAPPAVIVQITQFKFDSAEITIDPGTTVQWVNRDQTVHNVVSRDGKFASSGMDTGDGWSFTFSEPGDYAYFCALHPHMNGIIHVKAHA
jgi:plastocyanin